MPLTLLARQLTARYMSGLTHLGIGWLLGVLLSGVLVVVLALYPPRRRTRTVRWVSLGVVIALGLAWGYALLWLCDDAFIAFRYAHNLAAGHGLVYNVGQRVEGYTNFLWTVLLAGGMLVHVSPLLLSTVLSLASFAGVLVLTLRLLQRLVPEPSKLTLSAAVLAVAGSYIMASFATSGLETMFATFLVLLALECAAAGRPFAAGLASVAAGLAHPDQLLFSGALALAILLDRQRRRDLWRFVLPIVVLYVPYFLLRWHYYGAFFPNTYYAKSANLYYFSQGTRYIVITIFAAGLFFALPLSLVGAIVKRRSLIARYFLIALPGYGFYVAKVGGDFMLGRFFVPLIPLVLVFAEFAARDFMERGKLGRVYGSLALCGVVLAGLPVRVIHPGEKAWYVADERTFYRTKSPTDAGIESHYHERADDLDRLARAIGREPVLASGNLGILGYYAPNVPIVDIFGLTDARVARIPLRHRARPGHEKIARGPYFMQRNVDISDDPIYPRPYSRWTRLRTGRSVFYTAAFKPDLMGPLRGKPGFVLPPVREWIATYNPSDRGLDKARVACDLWFFDQYYFSVNHDPALRRQVIDRVVALWPAWKGLGPLLLSGGDLHRFRSRRLFSFNPSEHWQARGAAFRSWPTTHLVAGQGFVFGQDGPYANSLDTPHFDRDTGELVSPEFTIEGDALTLKVGGGDRPNSEYAALVVDGDIVRRATGCNAEVLCRHVWGVSMLRGKRARIRIVDSGRRGWGHVMVDDIVEWYRNRAATDPGPAPRPR